MNFGFYAFSGTGNTMRVCRLLADELNGLGAKTNIERIFAGSELSDPNDYDGVVIAFPVHAFNAPTALLEFLKTLPKYERGKGKPVWLVRVSGEPLGLNRAAGILPKRILKKRGYAVKGEFSYVMPYNIIFRHSDGMAARMQNAACLLAKRDAQTIFAGEGKLDRNGPFRRFVSFVLRIEHTAMPILGKRFKAGKDCTGCGACVKLCPRGNIEIKDGKPVFHKSCVGCMACAHLCPHDALKISVLNGWRVNGAYRFGGEPATDKEVCRYCRRAYLKYFREAEKLAQE